MGPRNNKYTLVPLFDVFFLPGAGKEGAKGDFTSIILKSPFIPLWQRGMKKPKTVGLWFLGLP
jgi:hypothetical protein